MELEEPFNEIQGKFYKRANKKQEQIINDIFGEAYLVPIQDILGDIIDLYPFVSTVRDSDGRKYQVIGASASKENDFYVRATDGSIYLLPQFSLFPVPDNEKEEQVVEQQEEIEVPEIVSAKKFKESFGIGYKMFKDIKPTSREKYRVEFSDGQEFVIDTDNRSDAIDQAIEKYKKFKGSEINEKKSKFAKDQKTAPMIKTESFADQVNRLLVKSMFHYHVGDTISSAIKAPFFWKGNVIKENEGKTLRIRLEPNRQLKKPDWKFIIIEISLNGMDELDITVRYIEDRFREKKHIDQILWQHTGVGIQISEVPSLDSIIGNHKAEMKENYDKAIAGEETEKPEIEKEEMPITELSTDQLKRRMETITMALASGSENKEELDNQATAIADELMNRHMDKKNKTTETLMAESTAPESEKRGVTDDAENVEEEAIDAIIGGNYANAYDLNKAIENVIDLLKLGKGELTPEVKQFISEYSGMGGLEKFGAEGKGLLYEYYTPDKIIERMWGLTYKHGYTEGRPVLEPAAGTGRFLKYLPKDTKCLAMEINPYSHFVAQALYGNKAEVKLQHFEQLFIKNNSSVKGNLHDVPKFDLVIGNPPYGNFEGRYAGMGEKSYTKAKNYVEYFILRGLDCLNKDGLLVLIIGAETSAGGIMWLDQQMNATKEMIAERGELVDAYRLPNDVFERTSVTSDIIVLKRM